MDESVIVIMLLEQKTNLFEKELAGVKVGVDEVYIVNAHAVNENGSLFIHLKASCDRDVEDWEFNAIYDYYDTTVFGNEIVYISELEDAYNPTWEIIFPCPDDENGIEKAFIRILQIHKQELASVYSAIASVESEYIE